MCKTNSLWDNKVSFHSFSFKKLDINHLSFSWHLSLTNSPPSTLCKRFLTKKIKKTEPCLILKMFFTWTMLCISFVWRRSQCCWYLGLMLNKQAIHHAAVLKRLRRIKLPTDADRNRRKKENPPGFQTLSTSHLFLVCSSSRASSHSRSNSCLCRSNWQITRVQKSWFHQSSPALLNAQANI